MLIAHLILTESFARPFFNTSKDILIAQFDSKPDPDDIHAQAALGCMIAHNDFNGVNYYAVAGAIGIQTGTFIDSDALFNMAFGNNWTDANADWWGSVGRIKNKVIPILQNGGKVWVQEAGQSNITADWIFEVLKTVAASIVKSNVIIVQHSKWNEDQTASSDLTYVKNKATYYAVDDGNAAFNASWGDRGPYDTPEYRSKETKWMNQAKSSQNAKAKQLWTEADRVIDNLWPSGYPHDWSFIHYDGVDYSDCVENWWILNIGANANSNAKFWSRYVTNNTGTTGPESISCASLPSSVSSSSSITVNVPYTANQARDVVVEFWNTGWLGQGKTAVNAGSSTATVVIPLSSAPAVGSGYLFKVSIRPTGGDWTTNIKACQKNGVSVTSGGSMDPLTVTLSPTNDTYLQGTVNKNESILRIQQGYRTGYLMFDLSSVSGSITDAKLKLTCNGDAGNGNININLGSSSNWAETNLTSGNAPSSGALLGSLNATYTVDNTYTWDLNESSLTANGNVSLIISSTGGNDAAFASKENSVTGPQLVLTYNSTKSAQLDNFDKMEAMEEDLTVNAYPNPLYGNILNIELSSNVSKSIISIVDMQGKTVYSVITNQQTFSVNTDILKAGLYLIKVKYNNAVTTQKLMVK